MMDERGLYGDHSSHVLGVNGGLLGGMHIGYGLHNIGSDGMNGGDDDSRRQDIADILQQIVAIKDQSLDEAQAR